MLLSAIIDENASLDAIPEPFRQRSVVGTPEQIAEQVKTKVLDLGIDGVAINIPTWQLGYRPGDITAIGEALKPLISG